MLPPYKNDMQNIQKELKELGNEVVKALDEAFQATKKEKINKLKNLDLSVKIVASRIEIVDNLIIKVLALFSPEAKDLRFLVSALKINNSLFKAVVNTKRFVKTFKKAYDENLNTKLILNFTLQLEETTKNAFEACIKMLSIDDEKELKTTYENIKEQEEKIDNLYIEAEKKILKLIKETEQSKEYFYILSALRKLENISDKALSIGNLVKFAKIGGELELI